MFAILSDNVAVVPLDDFVDNGKSDTGSVLALVLRPVEPLEQLRQLVRGHTSAVIFNDAEERGFGSFQLHTDYTIV